MVKFYKCNLCGKVIYMFKEYPCPTMCCGEEMEELVPNTVDASKEKHVPVFETEDNTLTVKIGEVEHPMEEDHYIEWIAVETRHELNFKLLDPGKPAVASFPAPCHSHHLLNVYAYCNKHGLWASR